MCFNTIHRWVYRYPSSVCGCLLSILNVYITTRMFVPCILVTSLNGLKPLSPGGTVQKPFVELYLLGPHIHGITRRYRTAPAKGQENFVFANEVKKM